MKVSVVIGPGEEWHDWSFDPPPRLLGEETKVYWARVALGIKSECKRRFNKEPMTVITAESDASLW